MNLQRVRVSVWAKGDRWCWGVYENGQKYAGGESRTATHAWDTAAHYADPIFRDEEIMRRIHEDANR